MLERLRHLDRRWIFLLVLLSAAGPIVFNLKLPAAPPTAAARRLFDELKAVPDNTTVICSFDFEPGSEVELAPAAVVTIRQLFRKKCKVITMALWPGGSTEARKYMAILADEYKASGSPKVYGVDYVLLGYKAGRDTVLRQMGSSFSNVFPTDVDGTPIEKIPMMARVNRFRDVSFVLSYSVGQPGLKDWINVVNTEYGVKIGGATTGVSIPEMSTYLDSGQLTGVLGGLRGAADYEVLVNEPGMATLGMNVQNFVHLLIMGLILVSNVIYFYTERRRPRRR